MQCSGMQLRLDGALLLAHVLLVVARQTAASTDRTNTDNSNRQRTKRRKNVSNTLALQPQQDYSMRCSTRRVAGRAVRTSTCMICVVAREYAHSLFEKLACQAYFTKLRSWLTVNLCAMLRHSTRQRQVHGLRCSKFKCKHCVVQMHITVKYQTRC